MESGIQHSGADTAPAGSSKVWRRVYSGLAVLGLAMPAVTLAQPAPVCDGRLFLSQDSPTNLNLINTNASPMTFTQLGAVSAVTYNALGYNPVNGVLYGLQTSGGNTNHLLQLGQTDGVVTDLGAVTGLPTSPSYNAGTFGSNGVYYAKPFGATNIIYAVDITVSPAVATAINLSQTFTASDIAWVGGAAGTLYSVDDSGQLYSINVTDGTVTAIGAADGTGGVLGAQFGGTDGLYGSANNGSGFYRIDLTTGAKTLISGAPGSGTNDGANCPNAPVLAAVARPSIPVPVNTPWMLLMALLSTGLLATVALRHSKR